MKMLESIGAVHTSNLIEEKHKHFYAIFVMFMGDRFKSTSLFGV